jgi:hypothetical protein
MSINAFLRALSVDETIQPLNRLNTDLHRRDESSHALIFGQIAGGVWKRLRPEQKAEFSRHLGSALIDITEQDLTGWEAIFEHLGVAGGPDILAKLRATGSERRSPRDYGRLLALLDELGNRDDVGFAFV